MRQIITINRLSIVYRIEKDQPICLMCQNSENNRIHKVGMNCVTQYCYIHLFIQIKVYLNIWWRNQNKY